MAKVPLIYGDPGSGKTPLLASFLQYYRKTVNPKAKARMSSCEVFDTIEPYIEEGLIEAWQMDQRDEPFDTTIKAAQGWWPADPKDPKSKLIPPSEKDILEYPIRFFEGLGSAGLYLMGSYAPGALSSRAAKGEKIGSMSDTVRFKDGDTNVGGTKMTSYSVAQNWLHTCIKKAVLSPFEYVIFTTWVTDAYDDYLNKYILGPMVAGRASTPLVLGWVGQTLHLHREVSADRKTSVRKLYLKDHIDPNVSIRVNVSEGEKIQSNVVQLVPFRANPRVSPDIYDRVPEWVSANGEGLAKALDTIKKLKEEEKQLIRGNV